MTNEEIKQLWSKAVAYATSRGLGKDAQDIAQEACLIAIEKGAVNLEWVFIGYLRKFYGDTRTGVGALRSASRLAYVSIDEPPEDGVRTPFHQPSGDIGRQPEFEREDWISRIDLQGREESIFDLVCLDGISQRDVGQILGMYETVVSQKMSVIRKKTNDAILIQDTWDRYHDDEEYSKLEINWITL